MHVSLSLAYRCFFDLCLCVHLFILACAVVVSEMNKCMNTVLWALLDYFWFIVQHKQFDSFQQIPFHLASLSDLQLKENFICCPHLVDIFTCKIRRLRELVLIYIYLCGCGSKSYCINHLQVYDSLPSHLLKKK